MIIRNVSLEIVCGVSSSLPDTGRSEVAFAGKSNVGKSSLINALMNRKSLARTSSQPGKTQTINFYNVNDVLYLVDLPGYGYTKASASVKEQWGKMVERYLNRSERLMAVFLLVDIRHEPSDSDRQMMNWVCRHGYEPVIIATKLDKLKRSQVPKAVKTIREGLGMHSDQLLIPFSSQTKQGREAVWDLIETLCARREAGDPAPSGLKAPEEAGQI